MLKLTLFISLLLLSATRVLHAAEALPSQDEPLPSPYFIDELHCSGINVVNISESWLLSKDEVEPARKVEQAEMCERIFHVFGIDKYDWLSPDDLERTATIIRQSGYFLESDLSIKKSELKNHVHIFLTVKPAPRFTYYMANDLVLFGSKGQASGRILDNYSFELDDRRFAPVYTNKFGANLMYTANNAPMNSDATQLTADDLQKMSTNHQYLADIFWKNQGALNRYVIYDTGIHFEGDRAYSDNKDRFNLVADLDVLYTKHVNVVNGSVFVGPAAIFTTYTPYEVPSNQTNNSKGVILPGFIIGYDYGQALGNFLKVKLAYYHSSFDNSIFQMNIDMQKHMHLFDTYFVGGFDERQVSDAVLPQDRFPLSNPLQEQAWIGLSKIFHAAQSTHQGSIVFGVASLDYDSSSLPGYNQNADFVGLRYKLFDGSWTVNVAAEYYFQRLY